MGNRVIGRGAVADADQHSRFLRGQIFGVFSKVIQTGSFNTVAAVPVEIRVAVKLYDIGFGVFLFQFGSQQDFHNLAGKGALLGQVCIFDYLLGNGTAALSHFPAMLDQGKTGPEGGNPVYAVMVFKSPVLLGDITVLQVHADVVNIHILIMTRVDQTDLFSVLIVDYCIGQHGKIGTVHLSKLVIGNLPAFVKLRFDCCVEDQSCCRHDKKGSGKDRKNSFKKPAGDS